MKKLIIFLVMLFSSNAFSQWQFANPYPTIYDINSASFINSQTGWTAGDRGLIFKTTNGGTTWSTLGFNSKVKGLSFIKFFDANTGYIGYHDTVFYKSTNGGLNWTAFPCPKISVMKTFFLNPNTGWICSYNGEVCNTTNGGLNWTIIQALGTPVHDIYFVNGSTGWFSAGLGGIYKSTNGGVNWVYQKNGAATSNLNAVYFQDENTGWVVGDDGAVLFTNNSGADWNLQYFTTSDFNSVMFKNSNTGYATGTNGTIIKTYNGGIDWAAQTSNDSHTLNTIVFSNVNTGYAFGKSGAIVKTINGGLNWVNIAYKATSASLFGIHFVNNYTGWTVGGGVILKSTNSGAKWNIQGNNNSITYRGVYAMNTSTACIVGDSGRILRTNNGGYNWTIQKSGTYANLFSVNFVNSSTGWITGDSGIILKTTNRGVNWLKKTGIADKSGKCIFFIDANTGWLACEDLYKTTDGGETWMMKSTMSALSVHFIDALTGHAVGRTYLFSESTDGGETWHGKPNDTTNYSIEYGDSPPATFTSVCFINQDIGFFTSNHTFECKVRGWNTSGIITEDNNLRCVYATKTGYAWAVGQNGTIVRTTNGGLTFTSGNVFEIPSSYLLHQNYPNPFNPTTTIMFDIPKISRVKIAVYDISGKEVSVIVNENMQAGTYERQWDGSRFSSGVYFYKITAGEFVQTKRMILVK